MTLYYECQINEKVILQTFFGDFAHWASLLSLLMNVSNLSIGRQALLSQSQRFYN